MKQVAGKHVYWLVDPYNPAAYEWTRLNCYKFPELYLQQKAPSKGKAPSST